MNDETRRLVEANLFPPARPAVEPWDKFRWHLDGHGLCDTWKPWSSQALSIDVFGTLKIAHRETRDSILNALARALGIRAGTGWTIELEWIDEENHLKESGHKTQVDALARSDKSVILFEGKFTETDGGCCSQVNRMSTGQHKGIVQCDGSYRMQKNPVNGKTDRCALSAKGIRYWEYVPSVFTFDRSADYQHCPFAGPWYQWMRNLTLASALTREPECEERSTAFVIAYADDPGLPFPQQLQSTAWSSFLSKLRTNSLPLATWRYQDLIELAIRTSSEKPHENWLELREWVKTKISSAANTESRH